MSLLVASCHAIAEEATLVVVEPLIAKPLPGELQIIGNVVSRQQVDLASEIKGQVANIFVEAGDTVEVGQPLIKLRDAPGSWQLAEAQSRLKSAKAELKIRNLEKNRLEKLLGSKSVSQDLYDQSVAQTLKAEADVEAQAAITDRLQDELERHTIRAPFPGVITQRHVELGDWLSEGDTVVNLASLESLRLELAVPQKYFSAITMNAEAEVRIERQAVSAPIERIIPFADQTRNFQVWLSLDNHAGLWIPGMSASATLRWNPPGDFPWLVSADALIRQANDQTLVWKVIQNGAKKTARPVVVKVSHQSDNLAAIASDQLEIGDSIIVKGNELLQPGQAVQVVN